jgi:hypothetical protein
MEFCLWCCLLFLQLLLSLQQQLEPPTWQSQLHELAELPALQPVPQPVLQAIFSVLRELVYCKNNICVLVESIGNVLDAPASKHFLPGK